MGFFQRLFGSAPSIDFNALVDSGAIIVDVRSPMEFNSGHIRGSINIPLDVLRSKTAELKNKNKAIITCCRSGARSGSARALLAEAGIEVYNGGAWTRLNQVISHS